MSVDVQAARDRTVPAARTPRVDTASFDDFYRAEMPALLALARALVGSATADDIAQDAMVAVYRRWDEVQRLDEPARWARRTCANMAVSAFRHRMVELRGAVKLARRGSTPLADEASEEFWHAVRALPRRQAQCAALRYVYAMSGSDIAQTLGISEGAVKVHLSRARKTLAARLHLGEEAES